VTSKRPGARSEPQASVARPGRALAARICVAVLALAQLGYVLPSDRVLRELGASRKEQGGVSAEAELRVDLPGGGDWPRLVRIDLHPEYGARVSDDRGGRWLLRGGRTPEGNAPQIPSWLPQLDLLTGRDTGRLRTRLEQSGVRIETNELARCDAVDCFVIGGRQGRAQLWLDKDTFEVQRWIPGLGRSFVFSAYRDWGGVRFPSEIKVMDEYAAIATLLVQRAERAPGLRESDFSAAWLRP
jgi:hypothetical protein